MKKRILCTLIFSLLVLTACSSDTPNATPDEITPTAIVEMQPEETVQQTTALIEKPTEPTEVETVIYTAKTEQQAEVEIIERAEEPKSPAQAQKTTQESEPKLTTKSTQKPTEKAQQEDEKSEVNRTFHEQDIHNMVSYIVSHNQSKGMVYDSTLNINNSGWLFAYQGCLNTTASRTYEEQMSRTVSGLDADIDSILALDVHDPPGEQWLVESEIITVY